MSPWRYRAGPALRGGKLPVAGVLVSVLGHALLAGALVLVAGLWTSSSPSRVYVVNLVAGLGSPIPGPAPAVNPQPRPQPPAPRRTSPSALDESVAAVPKLPPLPVVAKPATPLPPPATLPRVEERKPPLPQRLAAPPRPPDLAPSTLPRLAERERPLPPRLAEPPRPHDVLPKTQRLDEKEQIVAPKIPAAPPPPSIAERVSGSPPAEPRPSPTPRQAEPSQGMTAVSAQVSDFPFTWYLSRVQLKVAERWSEQPRISEPPQRPLIFVEIFRDGSIKPPRLEKSSGNAFYDQAALRAVIEASPFPPLPQEWNRPTLRILFGFELQSARG